MKEAAKQRNNELFIEIKDEDLIAKEFKYHYHCYVNLTRGFAEKSRSEKISEAETSSSNIYEKGDFEKVEKFVLNEIIGNGRAVSMKELHSLYGLSVDDTRYRSKLKKKLESKFPNDICFLSPKSMKSAEYVANKATILEDAHGSRDESIRIVANYLREDITNHATSLPHLEWPPSIEQITSDERKPPRSVTYFFENLLKSTTSTVENDNTSRLIDSYAQDLVHGVTKGKIITEKHYLMGLGLHNLTGQKNVVEIVNKFGNSISYPLTCEILTTQAESAIKRSKMSALLPLQPQFNEAILTFFWVDNLDLVIDKQYGGGAINITSMMAFQENNVKNNETLKSPSVSVIRKKSRKLTTEIDTPGNCVIDVKKSPPQLDFTPDQINTETDDLKFNYLYMLWLYIRKQNSYDELVSTLSVFLTELRYSNRKSVNKTVETYLPPINHKVTDHNTITKYLDYLTGLSQCANMPYVNITLDVGAAINAFKVVWDFPELYNGVVIHLGSFHFMKENFQVFIHDFLCLEPSIMYVRSILASTPPLLCFISFIPFSSQVRHIPEIIIQISSHRLRLRDNIHKHLTSDTKAINGHWLLWKCLSNLISHPNTTLRGRCLTSVAEDYGRYPQC